MLFFLRMMQPHVQVLLCLKSDSQGKKSEKVAEQDLCSSCCTHMATSLSRSCPTSKPSMQT